MSKRQDLLSKNDGMLAFPVTVAEWMMQNPISDPALSALSDLVQTVQVDRRTLLLIAADNPEILEDLKEVDKIVDESLRIEYRTLTYDGRDLCYVLSVDGGFSVIVISRGSPFFTFPIVFIMLEYGNMDYPENHETTCPIFNGSDEEWEYECQCEAPVVRRSKKTAGWNNWQEELKDLIQEMT